MYFNKILKNQSAIFSLVLLTVVMLAVVGCNSKSTKNASTGSVEHQQQPSLSALAVIRTITCGTTTEIQNALKNALPGDRIVIKAGTYTGSKSTSGYSNAFFYSGKDGTATNHIIVESETTPVILQGTGTSSGYALYITGDYWEIRNLKTTNAQKGIVLDNSNYSLIDSCEVYGVGQEGIHLRDNSANDTVQNCKVHDTGRASAGYGEGIYIGTDNNSWDQYKAACNNNLVKGCTVGPNVTAEHVDIKEGTTGTIIDSCTFNGTGISGSNFADSFIDAKGNNAIIRYNTCYRNSNSKIADAFQVHQQLSGWGLNNDFNNNIVYLDTATPYVVNVATGSAKASNNTRNPSGNMYKGNVTTY